LTIPNIFRIFAENYPMRILFLTYHGFDAASGITKKMQAQIKGLRQNGNEVYVCTYDMEPNGDRCRYVDGKVIQNYGQGVLAAIRQRYGYQCIYNYCIENNIRMVYVRHFMNASYELVKLFKKLKKADVKSVMEIPTYPYDQEFRGFPLVLRTKLHIDQLFRHQLAKQMEGIITFSDEESIFGQRTIRVSNGVDMDGIPIHQPVSFEDELHLIGVAEVHVWHGYDRLIRGLGEYYRNEHCRKQVFFHIVGAVWPNEMNGTNMIPGFKPIIEEYKISDKVIFHGALFGKELDEIFNKCQFAVGSLGRHRSGIVSIKTLKNREYACRGIPFIYSECDSDFEDKPYIIKAPADESPIEISKILSFMNDFQMSPQQIRKSIENLTWKKQMAKVIDSI
jgi:hypothetical protein